MTAHGSTPTGQRASVNPRTLAAAAAEAGHALANGWREQPHPPTPNELADLFRPDDQTERRVGLARELHPNWRGDEATAATGRDRAERWYPDMGTCQHEGCESPALDRHHVDGNTLNNDPSNVRFLCRRHHMVEDGRMEFIRASNGAGVQEPKPCRICGQPWKPMRAGRCERCAAYRYRTGQERPTQHGDPYHGTEPCPDCHGRGCWTCDGLGVVQPIPTAEEIADGALTAAGPRRALDPAPVRPCRRWRCPPEGCWSDRCWQDRDDIEAVS